MEDPKKMESKQKQFSDDDDVSVIAVIRKENDRWSMEQQDEKPVKQQERKRVFELSDERCKMALRKQLDLDSLSTEQNSKAKEYEAVEILRKLPPGTIVIKREKIYKDDSDYVRESTETSSGGSSSSSGVTKVKRIHRATRKNRGTAEVRRNPTRVTKKDQDKDFSRPRQRLLSAKRKEMLFNSEHIKRGKSSTMPYMNTRSVTRKMYNVGATYQAPTVRDATEWKEWPAHGMHERPVFHPQVGLAAEYLGRYFTSLDGFSYREIIDRPEIEVVSVDPHCDYLPSSAEKKRTKKIKPNKGSSNSKGAKSVSLESTEKNKSFETCMHESFHCVLGYCSQIMTPSYKTNVEGKISMLNESKNLSNTSKEIEQHSSAINTLERSSKSDSSVLSFKENLQKPVEENKFMDNYAITMFPQNVKNFTQVPKTRLFPAQKVYIANPQKSIAFTNAKTFQGGHMKIQEMARPSKSPFIIVNPLDTKETQLLNPSTSTINVSRMEESSASEETLGEVTSIYKNVSSEEMTVKQAPVKQRNKVEFTMTKHLLDNMQQNKIQFGKESNSMEKKICYETTSKQLNLKTMSGGMSKAWCTGEASEIAKILSEYNKSNLKKPAIENQIPYTNVKNIRVKELCNKEENTKQSIQESFMDRNVNITFPQGKWRRFHLTVEKLKDLKSNSNEKRQSLGIPNKQSLFKIDQTIGEISSDRKIEVPKQVEIVQRGQSSIMNLEKKESILMVNNSVDSAIVKTQSLQELLENTAMLYCAATGTHQDDLANYIDNLDGVQSIQWLESCKDLIV
ncbi:uncharacterized protein LOC105680727 [Bombus impatiens]|uniref:Uncharacterized protein LOC105680727 n=1 Tax=Bombus impatiens TaxID=132113 RepID=A0A6P3UTM8_BOMIM|nr:uncharacterized protein LOC105680727 [Bombus impatiens]